MSLDNRFSSNAPKIPPSTTPMTVGSITRASKLPLSAYTIVLTRQSGNITAMAVACDLLSSNPKMKLKAGTASIPPPAPKIPLTTPINTPANAIITFLRFRLLASGRLYFEAPSAII